MAIYHLSVKTISRSAGRSATAAAAYRAGCRIADERTGEIHDYTRKGGVQSADLVLPDGAPEWASDRSALWNAAEAAEKRKNSTVAREFEIALPSELEPDERKRMAIDFAKKIVERHQCAADVSIHSPDKGGDNRNFHAHILLTTRRLLPEGFTEKTRELDDVKQGEVAYWREQFARFQNFRLHAAGLKDRVDHRSLKAQGIDREPTKHLGPAVTGYERRTGQASRKRLDWEREVADRLTAAKEQGEISRQVASIEQTILDLSGDLERAKAERSQQVSDKYGLKAAAQAVERLNSPEQTGQKSAKKLSIANLYGVGAVPKPNQKSVVSEAEKKPEPTVEQPMSEDGWGVKIAGLKPVPEQQRKTEAPVVPYPTKEQMDRYNAFMNETQNEVLARHPDMGIYYELLKRMWRDDVMLVTDPSVSADHHHKLKATIGEMVRKGQAVSPEMLPELPPLPVSPSLALRTIAAQQAKIEEKLGATPDEVQTAVEDVLRYGGRLEAQGIVLEMPKLIRRNEKPGIETPEPTKGPRR